MSNARAAAQAGFILLQDYQQNRSSSAVCQYLRFERERPGILRNPFLLGQYERLCEPFDDPPPPPPAQDFIDRGGVNCRLYEVTFETGTVGQPPTVSQFVRRGPIRLNKYTYTDQGAPGVQYTLYGGDGIGCPISTDVVAGSSNTNIVPIFCNLVSIVALEGDPETEIPIPRPPEEPPDPPLPPFGFDVNVQIDGLQISVPVNFEFPITTNFGPFIPFTFAPSANFNLDFNPQISNSPRFGIDLDLDVTIPLGNGTGNESPLPGAEPVPIPGNDDPLVPVGVEVDYERIEEIVRDASCCPPVGPAEFVGTFEFLETNDVYRVSIPDDSLFVRLTVTPDNNSRRYKLAGTDSEIALGNASVTSSGYSMTYGKVWVRQQLFSVPENLPSPGFRVSLKQGCICTVEVYRRGI